MPFRQEDISAFGPKDLKILHEVFELAWEKLLFEGLDDTDPEECAAARSKLAKCIMANATPGQLDVRMLLERCLYLFNQKAS
jgi:hypothetical protein